MYGDFLGAYTIGSDAEMSASHGSAARQKKRMARVVRQMLKNKE